MVKPILLIVFNRPDLTLKVLNEIKNVSPSKLYIAVDGPREKVLEDKNKCLEVLKIVKNIAWDCEVHFLIQEHNLGCSMGPRKALEWFFLHEESGIILEDDCLPSKGFFLFCSELLDYYKNEEKIINICGSNMGDNKIGSSGYFFSRFMNMSGWATWRRSVNLIDYDLNDWKNSRRSLYSVYEVFRQHFFDTDIGWYNYWKHKFDLTTEYENVTWWDWQWIYYQINNKKFTIIPNKNLVSNIGFNEQATHTKDSANRLANIPLQAMHFPLQHPLIIKPDFKYEEYFVKWVWCYHKRTIFSNWLKQKLIKLFKSK